MSGSICKYCKRLALSGAVAIDTSHPRYKIQSILQIQTQAACQTASMDARRWLQRRLDGNIDVYDQRCAHTVEAEPKMPLQWVLRDLLSLTGTKFGCADRGRAAPGDLRQRGQGCQLLIAEWGRNLWFVYILITEVCRSPSGCPPIPWRCVQGHSVMNCG